MKKNLLIALALMPLFLMSCTKDNALKESVFIYDPENIYLPEYSEWGYNTFGAYYDREIFVSNNELVPAKVIVSDTSFSLLFNGEKGPADYYYHTSDMMLTFTLIAETRFIASIRNYSDLGFLNDSIIDLTNSACKVLVTIDTTEYAADVLSGELNFKRVQILQVDNQQVEAIVSGLFDFKAIINDKPVTISDGRFDVGIGNDNFYIK